MSTDFHVYVGPFIQCKAIPYRRTGQIVERTNERIWRLPDEGTANPVWHIWISNGRTGNYWDKHSCSWLTVTAIEQGTPETEIGRFLDLYKRDIDIVREVYGRDNVELRYGAIAYFM